MKPSTLCLDDFMEVLDRARRYDKYVAGLCVFHDDAKPSLLVYEDGWFRCRGCGRTGTFETLWRTIQKGGHVVTPPEKTEWRPPVLPKKKEAIDDLIWKAHQDLLDVPSRGWYLEGRCVGGRVEPCKLGWYNGWYTVPILDADGEPHGVVLRSGPHVEHVSGQRFIQPVGQKPMLYVPDWNILGSGGKGLVVVYGLIDALSLSECRVPVCTTTGGKDAFPPEWLDGFRGRIGILPDLGEEDTARKLAAKLGWRGMVIKVDWPDGCKDPNDVLVKHGKKGLLALVSSFTGAST